ncbi:MAG: DUF2914 domain-containing protein [Candidatus Latescibacteria bacterium]|nr:DUF2914 domain-containing protein [bacterium]MBD3423976.1 DUF2914 domain-containing protein [Candidatus Latescibacterota bacterium]
MPKKFLSSKSLKMEDIMKRLGIAILIFALSAPSILWAESSGVEAEEMVFCRGIKELEPIGVSSQFFGKINKIYCFTRITGAPDTTTVYHVWYHGDREMARVMLPIKSASWRTWSSKKMIGSWDGAWRVDVTAPDSSVIATKEFIYKPGAE